MNWEIIKYIFDLHAVISAEYRKEGITVEVSPRDGGLICPLADGRLRNAILKATTTGEPNVEAAPDGKMAAVKVSVMPKPIVHT